MNHRFFLFLFFCFCTTTIGFAQASLAGTVQEADGDPVIGAVVNLVGPDGELNTLADADGDFLFSGIVRVRKTSSYAPK
ncbi:MAG: carboxypeptidase-like regulatory domain-containing protein [Bacteroidota bacterium]